MQIDAAAKRVGVPDILFNCSGYVHHGTILETDDKAWDFSFDLNVKAHYRMIKAFMPGWLARGKRHHRQHGLGRLLDQRRGQPFRLWRHQGGGDRHDQGAGRRFHLQGHPRQRHLPRNRGNARR